MNNNFAKSAELIKNLATSLSELNNKDFSPIHVQIDGGDFEINKDSDQETIKSISRIMKMKIFSLKHELQKELELYNDILKDI